MSGLQVMCDPGCAPMFQALAEGDPSAPSEEQMGLMCAKDGDTYCWEVMEELLGLDSPGCDPAEWDSGPHLEVSLHRAHPCFNVCKTLKCPFRPERRRVGDRRSAAGVESSFKQ